LVDAMAALLVRDATRFDVIVTTKHVRRQSCRTRRRSSRAASASAAASTPARRTPWRQAQHGSAPDIAGQDRANPTSLILSAAMLLDWLGERMAAKICASPGAGSPRRSDAVLAEARRCAPPISAGLAGTRGFGAAVAARLRG